MKMLTKIHKNYLRCQNHLMVLLFCAAFASAQTHSYTVQIASAPSEAEAAAIVADLRNKGVEAYWVRAEVPGKGTRFRVRIGRFNNQNDAKLLAEKSVKRGLIKEFLVAPYETPTSGAPLSPPLIVQKESKSKPPEQPKDKQTPEVLSPRQLPAQTTEHPLSLTAEVIRKKAPVKSSASPLPPESPAPNEIKKPELSVTAMKPAEANAATIASPLVADALADFSITNNHWKVVRRSAETDKNLRAIHFVDSMTGWAAGDAGAVYRTTDGGRSWKPLLSGASANIDFIYFVDWNNGWMLGEVNGKETTKDDGGETLLFITTNGGRTWSRQKLPHVLSLSFTDAKNGWAVGKDATLLKTGDGGEHWSVVAGVEKLIGLPVESSNYNFGFRDAHFIDADHGWMIGNFYGRARNNIGGLFVTADGGASWKRIPLTLQTQYTSGRFTPGLLHSVRFTDVNTGSVTGEMYDGEGRFFFVLHTRDGGKTWEQFRTPSRATHHTQFLDLSNGWSAAFAPREGSAEAVVYDTTLMRTDNGGMSWQNDFVARGRRIRSVFFISPSQGWAVGDRGMILRYEDKPRNLESAARP